jgi:hypothetical protein
VPADPGTNVIGIVNTRSATVPSWGHGAGSVARLNGRDTSNSNPQLGQRKSYSGISRRSPLLRDCLSP